MELKPQDFIRAFPITDKTLCSEPVVAWAASLGHKNVSRFRQMRLWSKYGAEIGASMIADDLALNEIEPDHAQIGDAILFKCDHATVLGVFLGEFSIVAGFGRRIIGRFQIQRAWRL